MSNRKNFLLLIVVSLALSLIVSGCSLKKQNTSTNESIKAKANGKIVVGYLHPDFNDRFLSVVLSSAKEYAATQQDVEVEYLDAKNDYDKQIEQVDELISKKVDVIIAIPVNAISSEFIVDKAQKAKIPVLLANKETVGREDAYVATNLKESGVLEMNEVAKVLNEKGNIAIMNGRIGDKAQIERTEGNKEVVKKYPNMNVIMEGTGNWNREKGKELMKIWLESGKKIDAVVANNDEMAIGAIMAAEEAGKLDQIVFAGIDGTPDALKLVEDGKLRVSIFQNAKEIGRIALENTIKLAKGENVEKTTFIPYEVITKENLGKYK